MNKNNLSRMKNLKYILIVLVGALVFNACKHDDPSLGNPIMDFKTQVSTAYFGDSIPFTINASDDDVPLSTLKAQLFFGEEMVSQTVIRTKVTGKDYTGKIYVPYYANIPNGRATLKFVLQNIHFTTTEKEYDLNVTRPDFPYLTLVTATGSYQMKRDGLYQYSVTKSFPQQLEGYIKSPKMGANGNEIAFGWVSNNITQGDSTKIKFSNAKAGKYAVSFNSLTYEAAPFIKLLVNNQQMDVVDDNNYKVDLDLTQGQMLTVSGIPSFSDWWIDSDFFEKQSNGQLKFLAVAGKYRITANFSNKYLVVEALNGSSYATLQTDGSGAAWIIGDGIGKPSLAANEVGWNTDKALCMAQVSPKVYQMTVVAGKSIKATDINFKFFFQKGWGGEFTNANLSSTSNLIFVGDGKNGRDPGNLGIVSGTTLEAGTVYQLKLDLTAGTSKAALSVTKLGVEPEPVRAASFNGVSMDKIDSDNYKVEMDMTKGSSYAIGGDLNVSDWWIDPDFFSVNGNQLTFLPTSGKYRITANYTYKYLSVEAMSGNDLASLQADGSGAIWIIGNGIAKPSMGNQVGWNTSKAICMAPIAPGKYQVTLVPGEQLSTTGIDFKFFYQKGWGGEFKGTDITTTSQLISITESGNLSMAAGASFNPDATYILTVDVSAGNSKAVLTVEEKL